MADILIAQSLRNGRALISDRNRWCQGIYRKYDHVRSIYQRCAEAAIMDGTSDWQQAADAILFMQRTLPFGEPRILAAWNDLQLRHEKILQGFDHAIAEAESND